MTFETRQAYAEVCEVLQYMPDEYVKKIPEKVLKLFETEKLKNYEVNINKSNPVDKNYLSKETIVLIAMLNYQYWCPNKKVKNDLYNMYLSNNDKYQKEIEEKYNSDNLFKKKDNELKVEDKQLIVYDNKKWHQKVWEFIGKFFRRKSKEN